MLENISEESRKKYFHALEAEYSRAFPSAFEKVEALGDDDEFVTKAEVEVHQFLRDSRLTSGGAE